MLIQAGGVKELRHLGGTVVLEDSVVHSLEKLAESLVSLGMSAKVTIRTSDDAAAINVDIGHDRATGTDHVLHAKPVNGEGSQFDLGDY